MTNYEDDLFAASANIWRRVFLKLALLFLAVFIVGKVVLAASIGPGWLEPVLRHLTLFALVFLVGSAGLAGIFWYQQHKGGA